jgi:hypothetical protein
LTRANLGGVKKQQQQQQQLFLRTPAAICLRLCSPEIARDVCFTVLRSRLSI